MKKIGYSEGPVYVATIIGVLLILLLFILMVLDCPGTHSNVVPIIVPI